MKVPAKLKSYRAQGDRTQQELIRKRRHNLFKRLKEFNDRYEIEIWLTMRMPSGRIYIFATDPNEPVPSEEQIREQNVPVIHKTPADYDPKNNNSQGFQDPPALPFINLPFCLSNNHRHVPEWGKDAALDQICAVSGSQATGTVNHNDPEK
ncbi:uncharacterized protein KD926_007472 [Aspergillus affinis]|uniref:uncharacterized protein n=1 Tax=Aspergillus affinis TaxID=1070780 RepID=UPI0022FE1C8E|nr:uncharacterized protein KD926_007472 [Aspergillus affinis]KAI9041055.1 hypothetical protein KD926_007472 [Aspergillus affinis]